MFSLSSAVSLKLQSTREHGNFTRHSTIAHHHLEHVILIKLLSRYIDDIASSPDTSTVDRLLVSPFFINRNTRAATLCISLSRMYLYNLLYYGHFAKIFNCFIFNLGCILLSFQKCESFFKCNDDVSFKWHSDIKFCLITMLELCAWWGRQQENIPESFLLQPQQEH